MGLERHDVTSNPAAAFDDELRRRLAAVVLGASIHEFYNWFVIELWHRTVNHRDSPGQLALRVELLLYEYSSGGWTETDLRAEFAKEIPQTVNPASSR